MKWKLDPGSGVPLYVQLRQQIIQRIVRGEWPAGFQLPTVRQMAVDGRINVNTVSKVYSQVEQEGFIVTHQGKGTFVRDETSWQQNGPAREGHIERFTSLVLEMAETQGISLEELIEALQRHGSS
ncbi:GntR family transcriptional regulator [Alicyclobacillus curvatus]|jgi:GntR family transcriptional regulator|nr:GntR family transcriptional regulator [Alicyclobacillus curvatus]